MKEKEESETGRERRRVEGTPVPTGAQPGHRRMGKTGGPSRRDSSLRPLVGPKALLFNSSIRRHNFFSPPLSLVLFSRIPRTEFPFVFFPLEIIFPYQLRVRVSRREKSIINIFFVAWKIQSFFSSLSQRPKLKQKRNRNCFSCRKRWRQRFHLSRVQSLFNIGD